MRQFLSRSKTVTCLAVSATLVGLAGVGSPAQALLGTPSLEVTEYSLPTPAAGPCEIEFDGQGRIWVEEVLGNAISRFNPATQEYTRFSVGQPLSVPGGMEFGPDGALWFPQVSRNVVTRLDPSDGSMHSYPIPQGLISTTPVEAGTALGSDITTGKDGAMWFSMSGVSAVGRIDVQTRDIEVIPLPTPLATTSLLTQIIQPGPGNTLVISLGAANKIATIDVFTREIKEYTIPTPASLPQGVTTDHLGNIWFTESAGQKFGRINVATGQIKEWSILTLRGLSGAWLSLGNPLPFPGPIRVGSDGKIYFAEGGFEAGNKIGQFDPTTGSFKELVVQSPLAGICDINNTQDGAIWFGTFTGNTVGKLTIG
jgi:virginiamycin B lyase